MPPEVLLISQASLNMNLLGSSTPATPFLFISKAFQPSSCTFNVTPTFSFKGLNHFQKLGNRFSRTPALQNWGGPALYHLHKENPLTAFPLLKQSLIINQPGFPSFTFHEVSPSDQKTALGGFSWYSIPADLINRLFSLSLNAAVGHRSLMPAPRS